MLDGQNGEAVAPDHHALCPHRNPHEAGGIFVQGHLEDAAVRLGFEPQAGLSRQDVPFGDERGVVRMGHDEWLRC